MKTSFVLILCGILSLFVAPVSAAPDSTLSIMSFNIRYGSASDGPNHWDLRKDLVFSYCRISGPMWWAYKRP